MKHTNETAMKPETMIVLSKSPTAFDHLDKKIAGWSPG